MSNRVLITCTQLQRTIDDYRSLFVERNIKIEMPVLQQQMTESDLIEMIGGFDGVIAGDDPFTAKVLEEGKRLKVLVRWGVGTDSVDLEAAKRLGIPVTNTPNVFADEVADVVMGYVVLLARGLHKVDGSVREGGWVKPLGVSLRDKTIGVIGVGSIGRAVAQRAVASGMRLLGYDVARVHKPNFVDTGVEMVGFEELLRRSDFISLNCTLSPANWHMLDVNQFEMMKHGVRVVNTARGALINEEALVQALLIGKVVGAALDVYEDEPLAPNNPLRQFDNCIFGTHNSSNTIEAVSRVNALAIDNLLIGLGQKPVG